MAIKKISANLLGSNAVLAANIAGGAISAADIADNSITAAKISASTSPTLGGLTLKDDFGSGVALTLDRTESSIVDTLFYLGVTSSVSAANDRMWFGTSTTDLTITDDGTIGIGTDNPETNLHIEDSSSYSIIRLVASSTSNAGIDFGDSSDRDIGRVRYYNDGDYMVFHTNADERVRIDSSGNVGIGTSSNLAKLSISNGGAEGFEFSPGVTNFSVANTNYIASYDRSASTYRDISFDMGGVEGSSIRFKSGTGNVGIGTAQPATNLHVFGTNPVVRVSDDGTTGYSTLELRQQNTGSEGTELMYDSGTGHTHLNTVYGADLKIATDTGSFGTTSTNVRLTVKSDGEIHVGKSGTSTDRINFVGNVNINAPSTSNHDSGTRLTFYDTSANAFYAQGIESNHMWFNADDGGSYKFYTRAVQKVHIDCSSPMPQLRVGTDSTNAMRLGSVTAVFPYSGPTLIAATPGATLTIHSGTNSTGSWSSLANSTNFPDYLRNTATFNTINTSQQANIIVYLNVATKVYLARDPGWNSVSLTDWVQIADNYVYGSSTSNVYVRYLPAGTHSLDNDSALYFFEAPIGP